MRSSIYSHLSSILTQLKLIHLISIAISTANSIPITQPISEFTNLNQESSITSSQNVEQASVNSNETLNPFGPRPISYVFDPKSLSPFMRLHKLSPNSNNVTCNDGSPVGYYIRQNVHSKSWIIYLQGGGFCGSEESCALRWQRNPNLMSSNYWPKTKTVDGILSNEPKDNPYLWNANHVYVPYCSSDSWTGLSVGNQQRRSEDKGHQRASASFSFMGSKIIERVLDSLHDDLPQASSLQQAKYILLAGDSAGATGVILNLDKVKKFTRQKFYQKQNNCLSASLGTEQPIQCNMAKQPPVIRGLADSGWFLDNEPYYQQAASNGADSLLHHEQQFEEDCDRQRCNPLQSIKQAMRFWNGQVPGACASEYPTEPWRCYFAYRTYLTLKTPLFVVQWLYDEAQLLVDNIARPDTNAQWDYVNKVANEMRASLENVTALFAPSCLSHSLITKSNWNQININGLKLPHVLNSWEEQTSIDSATIETQGRFIATQLSNQEMERQLAPSLHNGSFLSITSQPHLENLMLEQDLAVVNSNSATTQQFSQQVANRDPDTSENRANSRPSSPNKGRGRKRKRNNQQKSKLTRQAASIGQQRSVTNAPLSSRESNDLQSYQLVNPLQNLLPLIDRSLADGNIMFERQSRQDKSTLGNSPSNGRSGRSTIVDDSTLMLGNSMPEDMSASLLSGPNIYESRNDFGANWPNLESRIYASTGSSNLASVATSSGTRLLDYQRFRLIDTCTWPQCNRDCPALSMDLNAGAVAF